MAERWHQAFENDVLSWCVKQKAGPAKDAMQVLKAGPARKALETICSDAFSMLSSLEYAELMTQLGHKLVLQCEWSAARACCFTPAMITAGGLGTKSITALQLQMECAVAMSVCQHREICSFGSHIEHFPRALAAQLECLKVLEHVTIAISSAPSGDQGKLVWLLRKAVHHIAEIADSFARNSCSKLVPQYLTGALLAMEAIPALSTVRHLKLRMKLYSLLVQCFLLELNWEQAEAVIQQAKAQIKLLREIEESDPPLNTDTELALQQAEADIAVLKVVMTAIQQSTLAFAPDSGAGHAHTLLELLRVLALGSNGSRLQEHTVGLRDMIADYVLKLPQADFDELCGQPPLCLELLMFSSRPDLAEKLSAVRVLSSRATNTASTEASNPEQALITLVVAFANALNTVSHLKLNQPDSALRSLAELSHQLSSLIGDSPHAVMQYRTILLRKVLALSEEVVAPILDFYESSVHASPGRLSVESRQILVTLHRVVMLVARGDMLRVGIMGLRLTHLLWEHEEVITALSIANELVDLFSEWRAQHNELLLVAADEFVDFAALQNASFTTTTDLEDWFNGRWRNGASGRNGMGIFGAESVASQTEQAIADLHLDLYIARTRLELQKAIAVVQHSSLHPTKTTEPSPDTAPSIPPTVDKNREFTHTVSALRKQFNKNYQLRGALCICMADVEPGDAVFTRLEEAERELFAAEQSELALIEHHGLASSLNRTSSVSTAPFIASVSSRYAYIRPNMESYQRLSKAQKGAAVCMRVFGKPYGAGTAVSITNDSLPGLGAKLPINRCEPTHDLSAPQAMTRVELLEANEEYVFASAIFDSNDNLLGQMSDTCHRIVAADILPAILLWAYLARCAFKAAHKRIALASARHVCDMFTTTSDLNRFSAFGPRRHVPESYTVQLKTDWLWSLSHGRAAAFATCSDILTKLAFSLQAQPKDSQRVFLSELRRTVLTVEISMSQGDISAALDACHAGYEQILRASAGNASNMAWLLREPLQVLTTAMLVVAEMDVPWAEHHSELLLRLGSAIVHSLVAQNDFVTLQQFIQSIQAASLRRFSHEQISSLRLILRRLLPFHMNELQKTELFQHSTENEQAELPTQEELVGWLDEVLNESGSPTPKLLARFPTQASSFSNGAALSTTVLQLAKLHPMISRQKVTPLMEAIELHVTCANAEAALHTMMADWNLTACVLLNMTDDGDQPSVEHAFPTVDDLTPAEESSVKVGQQQTEAFRLALLCTEYASVLASTSKQTPQNEVGATNKGPFSWAESFNPRATAQSHGGHSDDFEEKKPEQADNGNSWMEDAVSHLSGAVWLFSELNFLAAAEDTMTTFWNMIVKQWVSPIQFCAICGDARLGQMVRALAAFVGKQLQMAHLSNPQESVEPFSGQTNARSTMLLMFTIECLFHGQHWEVLVWLGQQLQVLWNPAVTEMQSEALSLAYDRTQHAQQEVVSAAAAILARHQADLTELITAWETHLAAKTGPKVRVRAAKSMEELEFEEKRIKISDHVTAAQGTLNAQTGVLSAIQQAKGLFEASSSSAAALVRLTRNQCRECISEFIETDVEQRQETSSEFAARSRGVISKFHKVVHVLRSKGERQLLLECLQELGDFCMFWQDHLQAQQAYEDAIDGFFNQYQTINSWQGVVSEYLTQARRPEAIASILHVICTLWKLNEFTHPLQADKCFNNSRFAAELVRALFSHSIGHPSKLVDYALYYASDMPLLRELLCQNTSIQWEAVGKALQGHINTLLCSPQPIRALPLSCVLDVVCRSILLDDDGFHASRLRRVDVLAEANMFSEAVQLLASVIYDAETSGITLQPTTIGQPAIPAFFSNLEVQHEDNLKALNWICGAAKRLLHSMTTTSDESAAPTKSNGGVKNAPPPEPSKLASSVVDKWIANASRNPEYATTCLLCCCRLVGRILGSTAQSPATESKVVQTLHADFLEILRGMRKFAEQAQADTTCKKIQLLSLISIDEEIVKLLLFRRCFRKAKARAIAGVAMVGTLADIIDCAELVFHWFYCKYIQGFCALQQGKYSTAVRISMEGATTSSSLEAGLWEAQFMMLCAKAQRKAGDPEAALTSLQSSLRWFERTQSHCVEWVEALALQVSIKRDLTDQQAGTVAARTSCLQELYSESQQAIDVAVTAAALHGWLGADNPMTEMSTDNNVFDFVQLQKQGDTVPPVLFAQMPAAAIVGRATATIYPNNTLCGMALANCYLPSVGHLCAAFVQRLSLAQELISALAGLEGNQGELFTRLVQDSCLEAERATRCMRYTAHVSPVTQANLLFLVGLSRLQSEDQRTQAAAISALRGSLSVAVHHAPHLRSLMYRACLALVEAFGQHTETDNDDDLLASLPMNSRLQLAMQMQQLAAELHSQCHKLDSQLFHHFSRALANKLPQVQPVLTEFGGKTASSCPTLRAALLLLRRLQGTADQLYCLDEGYSHLQWLHTHLAQCSADYQACCVTPSAIQLLLNPASSDGNATVAAVEGSICTTSWSGWTGAFAQREGAPDESKAQDCTTMYFLLGPVKLAQAVAGGLEKNAGSSHEFRAEFPEPYLAKANLSRAEVNRVSNAATKLRLRLSAGETIQELQPDLHPVIVQLSALFGGSTEELFSLSLTPGLLEAIQAVFDGQSASGTCVDHVLCYLLRTWLLQL